MPYPTYRDRPTQAVILAGGQGTRLRPLTNTRPKPMIEFHGKPFLEYLIELVRDEGFRRVLLLLGYLPEAITTYFGDGSRWGVKIEYSITPMADETGTRLKAALAQIDPVFLLMYCDNYVPIDFEKMWEVYCKEQAPAMVTAYWNGDGLTTNNMRVDETGRVVLYDKTRTAKNLQGVDIGFIIMDRAVLELLSSHDNESFEEVIFPQLVERRQLHAYITHHRYYSVGDHRRLPVTDAFLARRPTVLIDRDGVLNKKMPRAQYVRCWDEWEWLAGSKRALRLFHEAGYRIIIISNQPGIARGALTELDLQAIHARMKQEVENAGGMIDAIYYCPHDWDEGCSCRKPAPGMLFQAQRDFHLDLSRTVFLGDDARDGLAAEAAGAPWIQVTGNTSLYDIALEMLSLKK